MNDSGPESRMVHDGDGGRRLACVSKQLGKRVISAAALIGLAMATLMSGPAAAHSSYDGDPDGEGWFYADLFLSDQNKIITWAEDINPDGHCVYVYVEYGGNTFTDTYSCGATAVSQYQTTLHITTRKCVTGHWDCDSLWSGYLGLVA